MATRSTIGILNADGTVDSIYCHNDGYIAGVGRLLEGEWDTVADIRELIELGDISCLGTSPAAEDGTIAYHRDRGDDWAEVEPTVDLDDQHFVASSRDRGAEFVYLYSNGEWLVSSLRLPEMTRVADLLCVAYG